MTFFSGKFMWKFLFVFTLSTQQKQNHKDTIVGNWFTSVFVCSNAHYIK